jgi:ribosomal protein L34
VVSKYVEKTYKPSTQESHMIFREYQKELKPKLAKELKIRNQSKKDFGTVSRLKTKYGSKI